MKKAETNTQIPYLVSGIVPGHFLTDYYIVLACNPKEAKCKMIEQLPGTKISSISVFVDDSIFRYGGIVYSALLDKKANCLTRKLKESEWNGNEEES